MGQNKTGVGFRRLRFFVTNNIWDSDYPCLLDAKVINSFYSANIFLKKVPSTAVIYVTIVYINKVY